MKAIIMAGGEGKRLRPLTCTLPKPMVPVMDKPVLEHLLLLLKKHGITEICLTLGYMAEKIVDYVGDGHRLGLHVECRTETTPLGTAGGVKACEEFLAGEDCLVLSGDGLMDFSISQCIRTHYEKCAPASVVLCHRHYPLSYGVVAADKEGWIRHFAEKPSWDYVCSDLVNTGVYIVSNSLLSEIPKDRPWDFGHDFFPALLKQNRRILGIPAGGYWCDIGNPSSYHQCCMDVLQGAVQNIRVPNVGAYQKKYGEKVTFYPPVWIENGVVLEQGATVGPGAFLGRGTRIGKNAKVSNTVLWQGLVGENAKIEGSILMNETVVGDSACIFPKSVLGEGTTVQEKRTVAPGTVLWPGEGCTSEEEVCVCIPQSGENRLLKKMAERLGYRVVSEGIGRTICREDQNHLSVQDETGCPVSEETLKRAAALTALQAGNSCFEIAAEETGMIAFLRAIGAKVVCPDTEKGKKKVSSHRFLTDANAALYYLLKEMKRQKKRLCDFIKPVPFLYCKERVTPAKRGRAEAMGYFSGLREKQPQYGYGVAFFEKNSCTWVIPHREKECLRILSYALREETAEEMCAFFERKSKELGKTEKKS